MESKPALSVIVILVGALGFLACALTPWLWWPFLLSIAFLGYELLTGRIDLALKGIHQGVDQLTPTDSTKAIELEPKNAENYTSRGAAYQESHRNELAISYFNRGVVHYQLEQYEKAITACTIAIELDPKYATAYRLKRECHYQLEQYETAITNYNQAIKLDPIDAPTYIGRGKAYAELEQYETAMIDYNKAIELDPKGAIAYMTRGRAYANLEQYEKAITDYNQAIDLHPEEPEAYFLRGNAFLKLGKMEEADESWVMAEMLEGED